MGRRPWTEGDRDTVWELRRESDGLEIHVQLGSGVDADPRPRFDERWSPERDLGPTLRGVSLRHLALEALR